MKKKIFIGLFSIICVSGLYYANKSTQTEVINLALENIEALASGEGSSNYTCYGDGDVECHGRKVRSKVEGWSLDVE